MGLFSGIGKMFGLSGRGPNPADTAMPYLNRIPQISTNYLDPFIKAGQGTDDQAKEMYRRIYDSYLNQRSEYGGASNDYSEPTDFLNKLMKSYTPSEGYKYKEGRMLNAARNAAAAGGVVGTQGDQENQAGIVQGLLGADMQDYLKNIFDILQGRAAETTRGLAGAERGHSLQGGFEEKRGERGFEAAKLLSEILGNTAASQASLGFQGQRQRNAEDIQNKQNRLNLLKSFFGYNDFGGENPGQSPFSQLKDAFGSKNPGDTVKPTGRYNTPSFYSRL